MSVAAAIFRDSRGYSEIHGPAEEIAKAGNKWLARNPLVVGGTAVRIVASETGVAELVPPVPYDTAGQTAMRELARHIVRHGNVSKFTLVNNTPETPGGRRIEGAVSAPAAIGSQVLDELLVRAGSDWDGEEGIW